MTKRLEITLSEEDWAKLEECRGHEPRASYVKRVVRQSFDRDRVLNSRTGEVVEVSAVPGQPWSVPAEAPDPGERLRAAAARETGHLSAGHVGQVRRHSPTCSCGVCKPVKR